jgi:hypothetical protein
MHVRSSAAQDFKRSNTPYTSFLLFPPSSHLPYVIQHPLHFFSLIPSEQPHSFSPTIAHCNRPKLQAARTLNGSHRWAPPLMLVSLSVRRCSAFLFPTGCAQSDHPFFLSRAGSIGGGSAHPGGVCASTPSATACSGLRGGESGRQGFRSMGACCSVRVRARSGVIARTTARRWGRGR